MNDETQAAEPAFFNPLEARVVACLMEKQLATPNSYPLTMNSLQLACNQKSNREPVMNLTEGQIGHTVNQLQSRKLVGVEYSGRANKITHRVMTELDINREHQAILAMLMLRGPMTLNEIHTRTQRMADFNSHAELQQHLDELMQRETPWVVSIPRGPGQREDRYAHLLCGPPDPADVQRAAASAPRAAARSELEQRIEALEQRLQRIEAALELPTEDDAG